MFYYTYITRLEGSEKYYVGRHQSKLHPDQDSYKGSGRWVRSIKDKTRLKRDILEFYEDEDALLSAEAMLITEHFGRNNCMNMNEKPVGFSSERNPSKRADIRERNRRRLLENNPMKGRRHTAETIELIRVASTGRFHTEESKKKQSDAMLGKNIGKVRTLEHREELSRLRKEDYTAGRRTPNYGMRGRTHTEEAREKFREIANNRERFECHKCGGLFARCAFNRWHGDNCSK